jgi:hypothetical protein
VTGELRAAAACYRRDWKRIVSPGRTWRRGWSITNRREHLSYERIVATIRDLYGVELSEGGIAAILRRAGECANAVAEQIKERVIAGRVIKSDETSARVRGRNYWQWVFVDSSGVYHHIGPSRGAAGIRAVLGSDGREMGLQLLSDTVESPGQRVPVALGASAPGHRAGDRKPISKRCR